MFDKKNDQYKEMNEVLFEHQVMGEQHLACPGIFFLSGRIHCFSFVLSSKFQFSGFRMSSLDPLSDQVLS